MLDAVLRRGQTLDNAAQHARDLPPADEALAIAIAGETLRRLPDLDALIDSATQRAAARRCQGADGAAPRAGPEDRRSARPTTPLVATALPLVDGGPRRLVHGVLGTLLRAGRAAARRAAPARARSSERWRAAWGEEVVAGRAPRDRPAARRSTSASPPDEAAPSLCRAAVSLAARATSGSPTRPRSPSLPAIGEGGWWVQDLAASLPARLIPADARTRARPLRRAGRQDHAARRRRP